MTSDPHTDHIDTVVVGGGQAGLAVGYHLARQGRPHVILEAADRIGSSWRNRWDGLRLFTPAKFDGLPGMAFPGPRHALPTKDEVAAYLEAYAARFDLPIRTGVMVDEVAQDEPGEGWAGPRGRSTLAGVPGRPRDRRFPRAEGARLRRRAPARDPPAARERVPQPGPAARWPRPRGRGQQLGGGDRHDDRPRARDHPVRSRHRQDADPARWLGRPAIRPAVLAVHQPRREGGLPHRAHGHGPRSSTTAAHSSGSGPGDLANAGVERAVGRTVGTRDGWPVLDDGRVIEAANVIWCTGFRPDFDWIRPRITGPDGWPLHERGVVTGVSGLFVVGMPFLYSGASSLLGGVGRDAAFIADRIAERPRRRQPASQALPRAYVDGR